MSNEDHAKHRFKIEWTLSLSHKWKGILMITKFVKKQKISLYHIKFKSVKNPSETQIQYSKVCLYFVVDEF